MSDNRLKPCPKCGSKRVIMLDDARTYWAECMECGNSVGFASLFERDAADEWNRMVDSWAERRRARR